MPSFNRLSCCNGCTAPACGQVRITVTGCNALALAGATVEVRGDGTSANATASGPLVATLTSDSTGVCPAFDVYAEGIYWHRITKVRFADKTGTAYFACLSPHDVTLTTNTPAAGYACACRWCADPWPATLSLTDSNGTITLNYEGNETYRGCYSVTEPNAAIGSATELAPCVIGSASVPIEYDLRCANLSGQKFWLLGQARGVCSCGPEAGLPGPAPIANCHIEATAYCQGTSGFSVEIPFTSCAPINVTFTLTDPTPDNGIPECYPCGTVTVVE